jgi:hypothetical protein
VKGNSLAEAFLQPHHTSYINLDTKCIVLWPVWPPRTIEYIIRILIIQHLTLASVLYGGMLWREHQRRRRKRRRRRKIFTSVQPLEAD